MAQPWYRLNNMRNDGEKQWERKRERRIKGQKGWTSVNSAVCDGRPWLKDFCSVTMKNRAGAPGQCCSSWLICATGLRGKRWDSGYVCSAVWETSALTQTLIEVVSTYLITCDIYNWPLFPSDITFWSRLLVVCIFFFFTAFRLSGTFQHCKILRLVLESLHMNTPRH